MKRGREGHQSLVYGLVGMVKFLKIGQWCKGDEQIAVSEAVSPNVDQKHEMAGEEAQLGAHVGPGEGSRNLKNRLPQGSVGGLGGVRRRLACQYGASPV